MLERLVSAVPGARGAVFCDQEGEFVDFVVARPQPKGCGELSDFEMKVTGAQVAAAWLTLQERAAQHGAGSTEELKLCCAAGTLVCRNVHEGYYLVLLLGPVRSTGPASHALRALAAEVRQEIA
jgi:hypothetical protein